MATTWAYLNGRWIPDSELSIGVDDLGFLMGATVTERLRTFRGQVFRLEEHLRRLRHSLEIVGLRTNQIADEIGSAIGEFVERNKTLIAADDDWSILAFATPALIQKQPRSKPTQPDYHPFAVWLLSLALFATAAIVHGLWPAACFCILTGAVVTFFAIRGECW